MAKNTKFRATITFEFEPKPEWYDHKNTNYMLEIERENMNDDTIGFIDAFIDEPSFSIKLEDVTDEKEQTV